jgi:hypothetical protein
MSGRDRCKDKRIEHAVAFLVRCQGASVPEAMCAAEFTLDKSSNTVKQMGVCRAYAKAICDNTKSQQQWKAERRQQRLRRQW